MPLSKFLLLLFPGLLDCLVKPGAPKLLTEAIQLESLPFVPAGAAIDVEAREAIAEARLVFAMLLGNPANCRSLPRGHPLDSIACSLVPY